MPATLIDKPVASEPLRVTLLRTVPLALIVGSAVTLASGGGAFSGALALWAWLARVVAALWFTFGGHWVELAFLRAVQPGMIQKGSSSAARFAARVGVWLLGGAVLGVGAFYSLSVMDDLAFSKRISPMSGLSVVFSAGLGAVGFVLLECVIHTIFTALGKPSVWRAKDGRPG